MSGSVGQIYNFIWDATNGPKTVAALAKEVLAVEGHSNDISPSEAESALLDMTRNQEQSRFAVACLLHLLAAAPDSLQEMPTRAHVFELFDARMKDIYRFINIDAKEQTYEKEQRLRDIFPEARATILAALEDFGSLQTLPSARNEFMRRLNHAPHSLVLKPFLPHEMLKSRIAEMFEAVESLAELDGSALISAYGKATQTLQDFKSDIEAFNSPLADEILLVLVDRLRMLADQRLAESPVSSPASLRVTQTEKKYPLHELGAQLRLQMRIANEGPGQALDVTVTALVGQGVEIVNPTLILGDVPASTIDVPIEAIVNTLDSPILIAGEVEWRNFEGEQRSIEFELRFNAQSADVPWEQLQTEDPYALEPVSEANELIGRAEVLAELTSYVRAVRMGNAFVTGQKRVGKTSIVKTLKTILLSEEELCVIYLEGGDYVSPDAPATIENLGKAICREISLADQRFTDIQTPVFAQALAPLGNFLGEVRKRAPKFRVLIILDEFDGLPVALYRRSEIGNAFFLTLRSLSGRDYVGFILVGGEKMSAIVSAQGEPLNKFEDEEIDYFDRERHWGDFADLVRMPVRAWGFEISDSAVVALYELSAGHPFFTKMICRTLFKDMVARRDAHVTRYEVDRAAAKALAGARSQSFAHFWEDGILEVGERTEEISVGRRQVLLALGESFQRSRPKIASVIEAAGAFGMADTDVQVYLRDFIRRGVLVEENDELHCKVKLFEDWLRDYGTGKITTAFSDTDAIMQFKRREQTLYVKPEEIDDVLAGWGSYRNVNKTADDIRSWLAQFGEVSNQRLMFKVLQGLRFYHGARIREKLREAHGIVRRDTRHQIDNTRRKRDDFLISYLDGPGKSGARYARLYADENNIFASNVVERGRIPQVLSANGDIQALVFIDDFVGTGHSASEYLREIRKQCGRGLERDGLKLVFVTLTGFLEGREAIAAAADELGLSLTIHFCDPLGNSDRVFSEESSIFTDIAEREEACGLAEAIGSRLVRRWPLGYSNSQAAVVFDEGCPNNSLPVLWERSVNWKPLFPRYTLGS